jgi:hypothetical protein
MALFSIYHQEGFMNPITRREFAIAGASAIAAIKAAGQASAKARIGLVQSTHKKLTVRVNFLCGLAWSNLRIKS